MFNLFKKIPSITINELSQLKNPMIIDVRTPMEYKNGHINGAKNIPLNKIDSFETNKQVYVICQSGMRSKRASKILSKKGIDVVNVKGGMSAWQGRTVKKK